jgi:hypothetical protein
MKSSPGLRTDGEVVPTPDLSAQTSGDVNQRAQASGRFTDRLCWVCRYCVRARRRA